VRTGRARHERVPGSVAWSRGTIFPARPRLLAAAHPDNNDETDVKQNDPEPQRIYHIADPAGWRNSAEGGMYSVPSLQSEGFIHCSFAHQVQRSLDKFFSDADAVVILEIDPALLQSELRFEPADNDTFPHVYGEINVDSVVVAAHVARDDKGALTFAGRQ
jgi:uncharacterized protein (DUF952 family)